MSEPANIPEPAKDRSCAGLVGDELREIIEHKISEARTKQEWHKQRRYYKEAEYFNGWANGLADLLKEPARRGRKPKPTNP